LVQAPTVLLAAHPASGRGSQHTGHAVLQGAGAAGLAGERPRQQAHALRRRARTGGSRRGAARAARLVDSRRAGS
jgi:hypothetical protein